MPIVDLGKVVGTGVTFTPYFENGVIKWKNDGGLDNPTPFDMLDYSAPAGYGLGGSSEEVDDWNTAIRNGFYRSSPSAINGPVAFSQFHGITINFSETLGNQLAYKTWTDGSEMWTRRFYNGNFEPWECLNPPMQIGVEYRTTERWNSKPVYAKMVDCGAAPNSATKKVALTDATASAVVSWNAYASYDGVTFPSNETGWQVSVKWEGGVGYSLYVTTTGDKSNCKIATLIKYTKLEG